MDAGGGIAAALARVCSPLLALQLLLLPLATMVVTLLSAALLLLLLLLLLEAVARSSVPHSRCSSLSSRVSTTRSTTDFCHGGGWCG